MFDLLDRPLLWISVKWPGLKPGGADGTGLAEAVENEIEVRVELKEADELETIFADGRDGCDVLREVVSDWRRIKSGGQPLPFTPENAKLLMQRQPAFFTAFHVAYLGAIMGRVETREGNSDALPADGQAAAPSNRAGRRAVKARPKRTANASA